MRDDTEKKKIVIQIKKSFQTVYLTLISIIQASVLGYLIYVISNYKGKYVFINITLSISSFLIIILIWNEYMMGSTIFKWIPKIKDSFIPFCLGISEILFVKNIFSNISSWIYSISLLCFIGYIAYLNMFHSSKLYGENKYIFELIGQLPKITMIWALIEAIMCILFGIISNIFKDRIIIQQTIAVIILFSIIASLFRARLYWNRIIVSVSEKSKKK